MLYSNSQQMVLVNAFLLVSCLCAYWIYVHSHLASLVSAPCRHLSLLSYVVIFGQLRPLTLELAVSYVSSLQTTIPIDTSGSILKAPIDDIDCGQI